MEHDELRAQCEAADQEMMELNRQIEAQSKSAADIWREAVDDSDALLEQYRKESADRENVMTQPIQTKQQVTQLKRESRIGSEFNAGRMRVLNEELAATRACYRDLSGEHAFLRRQYQVAGESIAELEQKNASERERGILLESESASMSVIALVLWVIIMLLCNAGMSPVQDV